MTVTRIRHACFSHSVPSPRRRGSFGALAIAALLATTGAAGLAAPDAARAQVAAPDPASVEIEDVVNVIGFGEVGHGSDGRLAFEDGNLVLATDKATGTIPLDAIRSFTIERSTTALMRGTEGKVIGFIPRGVGNLYHAVRRGAHTLTIYYVDRDEALHGAILIVPKKRKDDVLAGFAGAGLSPSAMPVSPLPVSPQAAFLPAAVETPMAGVKPPVIIMLPDLTGQALPEAYTAAIYEQLNAELARSGLFGSVWRHGDARAPADALTLSVRVKGFKKGNPGLRGGLPLFGMLIGKTLITADLTLADPSGAVLLYEEVKGSKRMSGESIGAAKSLAQRVSDSIDEAPGFDRQKRGTKIAAR